MDVTFIKRISDQKTLSQDDLDYAINLLIEAEKIKDNSELYNNILDAAKKKARVYRSLKSLREASNEMQLNPGKQRGEDDDAEATVKTSKKSKKKD